ncbi:TraB/GumN family protein [Sphingomonas sp. MAH-20]|uniref:TraB/GumN family protein n=1 Tax=Sphingomonas horti TaxID=2682842 RepID=A0A6I4J0Y8_9SPHN|nr:MULTISPECIES: TraB/GumN family protein [Sphingomonas]MBA2919946.1 TraB/GumN family protein [Sphingomonas sp. CGMCC 1.13658]MVO77828.1 TraB/GumN family protein [Sphingomonas horti]
MRNFATLLLTVALAACGSAAPAAPQAKPAMWKLSDPDTTIYLFGTVHVLPDDLKWRTPRFDQTVGQAKELVLEINDQDDKTKVAEVYRRLALSPGLPPILDRVPDSKRAALAAAIGKAGLKPEQLDHMETWAVAVTIGASMYAGMGASADNGVENQLRNAFKGRPVEGLETTEQQLGYFDTMPEATQRKLLVSMIDDVKNASADFRKMLTAWSSGDTGAIARTFDDELKKAPEIAHVLIDQRNANWVDWLKQRLDQPGTVLVAVGAGHLAGNGSVIDLLRKQGLKVERVQ